MKDVLTQKIAATLAMSPPPLTKRDVRLPLVRGKARAVIGMRRSGKMTSGAAIKLFRIVWSPICSMGIAQHR